jgi:hypothetical protein
MTRRHLVRQTIFRYLEAAPLELLDTRSRRWPAVALEMSTANQHSILSLSDLLGEGTLTRLRQFAVDTLSLLVVSIVTGAFCQTGNIHRLSGTCPSSARRSSRVGSVITGTYCACDRASTYRSLQNQPHWFSGLLGRRCISFLFPSPLVSHGALVGI